MSARLDVVPLETHHLLRPARHRIELHVETAFAEACAVTGSGLGSPPEHAGSLEVESVFAATDAARTLANAETLLWTGGPDVSVERDGEQVNLEVGSPSALRSALLGDAVITVAAAERWCTGAARLLDAVAAAWDVGVTAAVSVGSAPERVVDTNGELIIHLLEGTTHWIPPSATTPPLRGAWLRVRLRPPDGADLRDELVARASYDPMLRADLPVGDRVVRSYAGSVLDVESGLHDRLEGLLDAGLLDAVVARSRARRLPCPGALDPTLGQDPEWRTCVVALPGFLDDRLHDPDEGTVVVAAANHLLVLDERGADELVDGLRGGPEQSSAAVAETLRTLGMVVPT
jgi:hypothetical protein